MTYYKEILGYILITYLLFTSSCNFYYRRLGYPKLENAEKSQLYDADFAKHNSANLIKTRLIMNHLYYRQIAIGADSFDTTSSLALRPFSKVKPFYYSPTSAAKTKYEYVCFAENGTFRLFYRSTLPNQMAKAKIADYYGYYRFTGDSLIYELVAPITGQRTDFGKVIIYSDSISIKNNFADANTANEPATYILYK